MRQEGTEMTSTAATGVERRAGPLAQAGAGRVIASYPSYEQAQRAVDQLADSAFPVEQAAIVGRDLRLVEQVTGRLTTTRATVMGAASGAWFGLFVGAVVGLFVVGPEWVSLILTAVAVGAVSGAIFGFVAQAATGGRRDFSSASAIVAGRYDLTVTDAHAQRATQLLSPLG